MGHVLKERDAEFAMTHVENRAELVESHGQTDAVKDASKERDALLAQLKRRVNDLMGRMENRTKEQEDKRLALQESELRCHRLRREIYESELERKRVLDVVRKVLERFQEAASPHASVLGAMLDTS